mgnify:CR=1 FL=1
MKNVVDVVDAQKLKEKEEKEKMIYGILVDVINELKNPISLADNGYYNSKYTPLPDVLEHVKPTLKKHGIAVLQTVETEYENSNQNSKEISIVTVKNSIIHKSGAKLDLPPVTFKTPSTSPHAIASAITYARRYSLMTILGIAGKEDDDDGNYSSNVYAQNQFTPNQNPFPVQNQFMPNQNPFPVQAQQTPVNQQSSVQDLKEINEMLKKVSNFTGVEVESLIRKLGKPLNQFKTNEIPALKAKVSHWLSEAQKRYGDGNDDEKTAKQELLDEVKDFIQGKNISLENVLITLGIEDISKADEQKVKQALVKLKKWKEKIGGKKEETTQHKEQTENDIDTSEKESETFKGTLLKKEVERSVATGEVRIKVEIENHEPAYASASDLINKIELIGEGQKVEAKIERKNLIPYITEIKVIK